MINKINNILKSVSDKSHQLLDIDRFFIALYDHASGKIEFPVAQYQGESIDIPPRTYKDDNEKYLPELIIKEKQPVLFENKLKDELDKKGLKFWNKDTYPLSWIGVPIIFESRVIGIIVAENMKKELAFGQNAIRILSMFARQAATAIRLWKKDAKLMAVDEMAGELNALIQLDEKEILEMIYEKASSIMHTDNMYIALYAPDSNRKDNLKKGIIYGTIHFNLMFIDGERQEEWSRVPKPEKYGRTEEIIITGKPILIRTRTESESWYDPKLGRKEHIGQPFASWIGVPMKLRNAIIGVIATYHKNRDYIYDENDKLVLSMMARQAAIAIENSRLFKQVGERTLSLETLNNTLEQKVKERTKQLKEKIIEIEKAQNDIANKERELVQSGMAMDFIHKMNNLAGPIPPWITLIKRKLKSAKNLDPKVIEYLDNILQDTTNILDEVNEFKKDSGPEFMKLDEVIGSIIGQIELMTSPDIEIIFEPDFDLYPFYGIRDHIEVAINNIIENCVNAISDSGVIKISLKNSMEEQTKNIEIKISDNGCGIPEEIIDSIFEYGITLWKDKKGTGYGLWRSKNIIKSMDGKLYVESEVEKGTSFTLLLPCKKDEEQIEE